jgi:hypothetical protein
MKRNENYGSHKEDAKPWKAPGKAFNNVKFVSYKLPDTAKQSLKEQPFTADQVLRAILELNDAGYSIKFRYDAKYSNYSVFLQHTEADHPNAGIILPGRGSSPQKALKQACFIHYEVCQGNWQGFTETDHPEMDD